MPGDLQMAVLQAFEYAEKPAANVLDYIRDAAKSESEEVRLQAAATLRAIKERQ